ncbi:CAP domain-containing protein [Polluticoccus soli]|uniref:CAP domain-containing protein n=1 Tax=Polluticoccus soli TaxID=3034150 RepID=UPI0023E341FD|nr:CAP domain-containing protein [Flavipsychrobacter sp. JY13-12]
MKRRTLLHSIYVVIVFTFISLASCTKDDDNLNPVPTTPGGTNTTPTASEQKLLELVNSTRAKGCNCGNTFYPAVAPVTWNDKLEAAAVSHSNWMNQNNTLSHTGANGSDPGQRITAAGYNWQAYGENVAVGYASEEDVIQAWLNSEGHCKNIMNGTFTEMGVGVSGVYWTQEFATGR